MTASSAATRARSIHTAAASALPPRQSACSESRFRTLVHAAASIPDGTDGPTDRGGAIDLLSNSAHELVRPGQRAECKMQVGLFGQRREPVRAADHNATSRPLSFAQPCRKGVGVERLAARFQQHRRRPWENVGERNRFFQHTPLPSRARLSAISTTSSERRPIPPRLRRAPQWRADHAPGPLNLPTAATMCIAAL